MPWKDHPAARIDHDLLRKKAKLERQLKKDPMLVAKLRVRALAGDDLAAFKLRLLATPFRAKR